MRFNEQSLPGPRARDPKDLESLHHRNQGRFAYHNIQIYDIRYLDQFGDTVRIGLGVVEAPEK